MTGPDPMKPATMATYRLQVDGYVEYTSMMSALADTNLHCKGPI